MNQMTTMIKNYKELLSIDSFEGRLKYLSTKSKVGYATFGGYRYIYQKFLRSPEWMRCKREVIIRDSALDLAFPGRDIFDRIHVHHIVPVTPEDILNRDPKVIDPMNLVCASEETHRLIHYSDCDMCSASVDRRPNDTCPWKL